MYPLSDQVVTRVMHSGIIGLGDIVWTDVETLYSLSIINNALMEQMGSKISDIMMLTFMK